MKRAGRALLIATVLAAAAAPWLAPNPPDRAFTGYLYSPPARLHVDAGATLYFHPSRIVNRLERRFEEQPGRIPHEWFQHGRLVGTNPAAETPLLLLGADSYGRDIFSRLLFGARASLGIAALATLATLLVGAVIGGIAGYSGGLIDEILSRLSDFAIILPATYVVLALRAVLPLILSERAVFGLLVAIFTLVGWPVVARGVRGIVASERERDYVIAGRAAGAGATRLLAVHLMPATRGYLATQATLLLPAFILGEATLSYVGLGFPDSVPTWGTMLHDAASVATLGDAPWTLAPAAAIFVVVLAVNLLVQGSGHAPVQLEP